VFVEGPKIVENMKSILLILVFASIVIAFEKVYAINAGGDAITDTDGIEYQGRDPNNFTTWRNLDLTNIAETDREIYKTIDRLNSGQPITKLIYNMPLKSDGFYALITKFSYAWMENRCSQNMTLNDELQLLPSFDVYKLCGGYGKICDVYKYFCVKDKRLYFENQSTYIRNGKISVEVNREKGFTSIAALVLLKGTLEERHTLKNSVTHETLFFDSSKMNPKC
jgi:Malectin domain